MLFSFVFFFLPDLFCRNPPPMQDSGDLHEHRDGWARTGPGQTRREAICKAQEQFSEVKKPSPEGSRAETLLTFRRGNNVSSHGIRPFSVYLSLLAPHVNHDACFFRLARPCVVPWHFSICSALRCRKARTISLFFFFLTPPPPPSFAPFLRGRRRIYSNTVLASLSGPPTVRRWSRRGLRSGEHEREQRGGGRDERSGEGGGALISHPPVEQKPLYFLPWNKSAFRLQTASRAWVLINIGHTLFMFPLMGYFLHVSLAPQVLMGRRVQREDGSCATPGFNLWQSSCLAWESVRVRVCMHPSLSVSLRPSAVLFEGGQGLDPQNKALNLFLDCLFWEWQFKIAPEDKDTSWIEFFSLPSHYSPFLRASISVFFFF